MRNSGNCVGAAALCAVVLAGVGAAFGGPALARPVAPDVQACATIASDVERLACYDRASGRPTARTPVAESQPMSAPAAPGGAGAGAPPKLATKDAKPSMLDNAWAFDPEADRYVMGVYRQNYLLLARFTNHVNNQPFSPLFQAAEVPEESMDPVEARFQLSFKGRVWATEDKHWGVWVAYTQQSQWQLYNDELSRPFRETNYMPEIMLSHRMDLSFAGLDWRLFNIGYNHQSNGRSDPISRSWDRIIAEFGLERGNFALLVRPWYRIPEDENEDDNADITDYMGNGDITAIYKWRGNSFSLMGRGNLDTKKGAAQLTWTSAPFLGPLRGYVQAFTGYGDSMIDYNWKQNSIGFGIAVNDLLDRP